MKKMLMLFIMGFLIFTQSMFAQKQKIIFDCDLGDDLDDGYALALLLASPEFDILGIVMDFGNTPERGKMACKFLYEAGREDIPVVVGSQTNSYNSPQFAWSTDFTTVRPIEQSAPDFIIEQLRKYPNEVILITVGPLPNISDVMKKDPDALKLAKKIVSMFGSYYVGYRNETDPSVITPPSVEWNVKANLQAAKDFVAYDAYKTFAGLDVTSFQLSEKQLKLLANRNSSVTNALQTVLNIMAAARPDRKPIPNFYDAATVAMILWPELYKTEDVHITVTDDAHTVIDKDKAPNCSIGVSVDAKEVLKRTTARILL